MVKKWGYAVAGLACALFVACVVEYFFDTPEAFFAARIQPRLEFCRNCHIAGGVADTKEGKGLQLTQDRSRDYQLTRFAWLKLGGGVETNPLLVKASDPVDPHSGGDPWPTSTSAYHEVVTLFRCWDHPGACDLRALDEVPVDRPLLGSARGGHYWHDYCEGRPDVAPVPQDPRELVAPGVNEGKAIYMNAWWQTCQDDDHPGTCGELRARVARGYKLIAADGEVGAGHFFGGSSPDASYAFPAGDYARMWSSIWSLPARPDNYDELVAERWGTALSRTHNPYPLDGEDPNRTNGGSGRLPMGLTQLRNADGTWTGRLNATCSICHGGKVGEVADGAGLGPQYGTNSLSDITVMFSDLGRIAPQQSALAVVSQNKVRGTGNITNFQLFGTLELFGNPLALLYPYLSIQTEPSTGTEDPPVWWNLGHRSAKFYDGGQVADSQRIELSFHFPNTPSHGFPPLSSTMEADKQWILDHQHDGDAWITSLESPPWPEQRLGPIDTALALQGAVLFHNKDLWAQAGNPAPRPAGGNGSCASCHGAYSPLYVNDPRYLDRPELEGIAAHLVPIEVIGTDPRRLEGNSPAVVAASRSSWFAYNDGPVNGLGAPLCGNWADPDLRQGRPLGYLAPPLYGVWATGPYFHNGSVPTVEQVLDPGSRPTYWSRLSKPSRPDQQGQVVMGFDDSLATGYDADRIGWRYTELMCGASGTTPYLDCNPDPEEGATLQDALSLVWASGGLAWNLLNVPIFTNQQIEDRKVYNTNYYSQSNSGHEFTSVLTAPERLAILEYLKTL